MWTVGVLWVEGVDWWCGRWGLMCGVDVALEGN